MNRKPDRLDDRWRIMETLRGYWKPHSCKNLPWQKDPKIERMWLHWIFRLPKFQRTFTNFNDSPYNPESIKNAPHYFEWKPNYSQSHCPWYVHPSLFAKRLRIPSRRQFRLLSLNEALYSNKLRTWVLIRLGSGNSRARLDKIKAKNDRLQKQRQKAFVQNEGMAHPTSSGDSNQQQSS